MNAVTAFFNPVSQTPVWETFGAIISESQATRYTKSEFSELLL